MRTKTGIVVSDKQQKTVVVRVDRYVTHPKYQKKYRVSKKFYAHDEEGKAATGDTVRIAEATPMSKLKRWTVVDVKKVEKVAPAPKKAVKEEVATEEK